MNSTLNNIADDPNYDNEASGASKVAVFAFIGTFIYEIVFTDTTAGALSVIAFVFIGMFVVSIFVAMPFFVLRKKFPKSSFVVDILSFVVTVIVTHFAFQGLFG